MKQKLISFFLAAIGLTVGATQSMADDVIGLQQVNDEISSIQKDSLYCQGTLAEPTYTGAANVTVTEAHGSYCNTNQGARQTTCNGTVYWAKKCFRKTLNSATWNDDEWVGYNIDVATGYKLTLTNLHATMWDAGSGAQYTWRIAVETSDGTLLFMSDTTITTTANCGIINVPSPTGLADLLPGTYIVKLQLYQAGGNKYFTVPYLTFTATTEEYDAPTYNITVGVAEGQSDYGTVNHPGSNSVPAGNTFYLQARPNEGYGFTYWTKDNSIVSTDIQYTLKNVSADASYVAHFKKLYTVTYNLGDYAGTVTGKVLCNTTIADIKEVYADIDDNYTIPEYAHMYLYREGYSFAGWSYGGETYASGDVITGLTEDITLTPTWTATTATLANSVTETNVTWQLGKSNILFNDWQGSNQYGYYTQTATVNGETIAVPMKITGGKISNQTRSDGLAQTNTGTEFTIPAVKGMTVTIADAHIDFSTTTIAGSTDYEGTGTSNISYTYTGTDETINIVIGEDKQYLTSISVTYPACDRETSDLTLTSDTIVSLDATTTTSQITATTSATVGLTYTSSNNKIATVSSSGLITAVANGTCTITVSQKGDAIYTDDSKTVTVSVSNGISTAYSVSAILNNESGTILTSTETAAQGNSFSFGINAANSRVNEDADDAVVKISGNFYNDHGSTNITVRVAATGNMKFTLGNCTYNRGTATLKNSSNETIASIDLDNTGCWKGSHTDITTFYYEGIADELTLTIPNYCAYIAIESADELVMHTVTFMNGEMQVAQKEVANGEALGILPDIKLPSEAQQLLGWYGDTDDLGTKAFPTTVVTDDATFHAIVVDAPTTIAGYYVVDNAEKLLSAINYANDNSSQANPVKIFLKNGIYDLGSSAEITQLTGSNISLIGESLDSVVITNIPEHEGLADATLLYNKGNYNYLQDLTLHNAYPYGNSTGRAASLKDEGNYTICKNVWLHSHQDTYYSHRSGANLYFNGGMISGCVDYMCGQSRVYFDGVTLINDDKTTYMTANSELYVFNNCTVRNSGSTYYWGRSWGSVNDGPHCVFLNTTLEDDGANLGSTRWLAEGMNNPYVTAGEYGTKDAAGNDITPASNNVSFTSKAGGANLNTILTAEQAATYTMEYTLGEWAATAASDVEQSTVSNVRLNGTTLTWQGTSSAYLIERDGRFVALTDGSTFTVDNADATYTVRAANNRGGFGKAVASSKAATLTLTTTLNMSGYKTFYSDTQNYVADKNTKVYIAKAADDEKVVIQSLDSKHIPSQCAVILKTTGIAAEPTTASYYEMTLTACDDTDCDENVDDNLLQVTNGLEDFTNGVYRLGYKADQGVKFFTWKTATPEAGIVYLDTNSSFGAKPLTIVFMDEEEDTTTAIQGVSEVEGKTRGQAFNTAGQRVNANAEGITIIDGIKYMK